MTATIKRRGCRAMASDNTRIEDEHKEAEARIMEQVNAGGFCVALSGGGHRATLATVGALMALVDRRLNKDVMQIASVSGGSITNAFAAQRCAFEELAPGEFDNIVRDLVGTVMRRGIITKAWLAGLLGFPALAAAVIGVLVALIAAPGFALASALIIFLGLLMFAGKLVERRLDRRYFQLAKPGNGRARRAKLASLADRKVDHVFCMTDLVLGLPVYLSGQKGGMLYRRLAAEKADPTTAGVFGIYEFQTTAASGCTIAEAVRASAGFPGIPPRLYRMAKDPKLPVSMDAPTVAFLADGGLWNNLGTQVQREDGFLASYAGYDTDGVLRPFARSPVWMPVLAVNGSAPLKSSHPRAYWIPGLAVLAAMLAIGRILNANTVVPRVDAMKASFHRRLWNGRRPDLWDPLDLVVDLSEVAVTNRFYGSLTWGEPEIRGSDYAVGKWERDLLGRARVALGHFKTSLDTDWLGFLLGPPEPEGSYPAPGLADGDQWDLLTHSAAWQRAIACHGPGRLSVPTTLDRIDPEMARRLIARGYLNTYLVSMYLGPLNPDDLGYLERLPERLENLTNAR
jgi:predicted acylesterase/phospholipase RssA